MTPRPKVLPKILMQHAGLPALFANERSTIISRNATPRRMSEEIHAALSTPGPYAGVKNWKRYHNREHKGD